MENKIGYHQKYLKNISACIRKIFDTNVPENAPGIFSFDDYWPTIKFNGLLKSDVTISRVVNASQQLEDIINRGFTKPAYKPLAIQIIYALSVHRLTTNGLDVQFGMTAENLKDDLCLYLTMPEHDADFLLGAVSENKNTCFNITYVRQMRQMIEVLRGKYNRDMTFKDTIDFAVSIVLDEYFCKKYPEFPVFRTKITRKNRSDNVRAAFDYFAGRKTQQAVLVLQSFGILDGDKIKPENSKYAMYFIDKIKKLPPQGVLNFSDLFEADLLDECFDKKFKISYMYTPVIFLSMVYAGYAVITLKDGKTLTASNLDQIPKINVMDLYEFKYLSRASQNDTDKTVTVQIIGAVVSGMVEQLCTIFKMFTVFFYHRIVYGQYNQMIKKFFGD